MTKAKVFGIKKDSFEDTFKDRIVIAVEKVNKNEYRFVESFINVETAMNWKKGKKKINIFSARDYEAVY